MKIRKILNQTILFFLLASSAHADIDKFFTSGCTNNGDGSATGCAGAPAGAGAWSSCTNANIGILALYPNLTIAGVGSVNLVMSSTGAVAEPQCTLQTIVTDSTHLVRVITRGADRPIVAPWIDATKPRFSCSTGSSVGCLEIRIQNAEIDGIQAENTATGTSNYYAVGVHTTSGLSLKITNSVARGATATGGGTNDGIVFNPGVANSILVAYNNIAFGSVSTGSSNFSLTGSGSNASENHTVLNNGAYGGYRGFRFDGNGSTDTLVFRNNWAQNNGAGLGYFVSGSYTSSTFGSNLTGPSDTSSPDAGGRNKTVSFVSAGTASGNFNLQSGDTVAKGQGVDLSGTFTTDLTGTTRTVPWDIGPLKATGSTLNKFLTLMKVGSL